MTKELSVTVTIKENDEMVIKTTLNEIGALIVLSQAITTIAMNQGDDEAVEVLNDELQ